MTNMKEETRLLLDKLYNLKSHESVILTNMNYEKQQAEETKSRTTKEKNALESKIKTLTAEETLLAEQGNSLVSVLKNINKDDFSTVLEKLDIDFDPNSLKVKVEDLLPRAVDKVKREKAESNEKLKTIGKEMHDASTMISELVIRREEALSNQSKLKEYFRLSLEGNINITREELTSLLAKFELSEDEIKEAAKILMFPEDGLFEYESYKGEVPKNGKSFSDVFAEAKQIKINEHVKEEPIKLEVKEEPLVINTDDSLKIKQVLNNMGFNSLDFSLTDLDYIKRNLNENILEKNVKLIRTLEINKDIFIDNVELLNDIELENKLTILLDIGKLPFDIYLNPNVLVKYNFNELQKSIKSLKDSGLDPKRVPLMAF